METTTEFYVQLIANVSAVLALAHLANQARLQRKAMETETYVNVNLEFLNTVDKFSENINASNVDYEDLTNTEKRTIDRYFYVANLEYIMMDEKTVRGNLSKHWKAGIASAANKKHFVERWEDNAHNLALNDKFVAFFEDSIRNYKTT